MNDELVKRIETREVWTFKQCLGLAAEFNLKPRFVIATVLAQGKDYVDGDRAPGDHTEPAD